jgi:hypothetical protein
MQIDEDNMAALAGLLILFIVGSAFCKGMGWI